MTKRPRLTGRVRPPATPAAAPPRHRLSRLAPANRRHWPRSTLAPGRAASGAAFPRCRTTAMSACSNPCERIRLAPVTLGDAVILRHRKGADPAGDGANPGAEGFQHPRAGQRVRVRPGLLARQRRQVRRPVGAFRRGDRSARVAQDASDLVAHQQIVGPQLVFQAVEIVAPAVEQIDRDLFHRRRRCRSRSCGSIITWAAPAASDRRAAARPSSAHRCEMPRRSRHSERRPARLAPWSWRDSSGPPRSASVRRL